MAWPSAGYLRGSRIEPARTPRGHGHGRRDGHTGTQANPYRGWTMVERPGGQLFMTRDNVRYVRVYDETGQSKTGGWSNDAWAEFHRLADEMEGRDG